MTSTSRPVVSIGRLATIPSAMRRAKRPSPLSTKSSVSSATLRVLTSSAAVDPPEAVHAHVQRAVEAVGKAPLGPIQLGGADAEVEQDSRDRSAVRQGV